MKKRHNSLNSHISFCRIIIEVIMPSKTAGQPTSPKKQLIENVFSRAKLLPTELERPALRAVNSRSWALTYPPYFFSREQSARYKHRWRLEHSLCTLMFYKLFSSAFHFLIQILVKFEKIMEMKWMVKGSFIFCISNYSAIVAYGALYFLFVCFTWKKKGAHIPIFLWCQILGHVFCTCNLIITVIVWIVTGDLSFKCKITFAPRLSTGPGSAPWKVVAGAGIPPSRIWACHGVFSTMSNQGIALNNTAFHSVQVVKEESWKCQAPTIIK